MKIRKDAWGAGRAAQLGRKVHTARAYQGETENGEEGGVWAEGFKTTQIPPQKGGNKIDYPGGRADVRGTYLVCVQCKKRRRSWRRGKRPKAGEVKGK